MKESNDKRVARIMRQHGFKEVWYDPMDRTWVSDTGAKSCDGGDTWRNLPEPAIKQPLINTCRNCGAPKHGAVCEYCKT